MKKLSLLTRMTTFAFFASLIMVGCKKEKSEDLTPAQEEEIARFSTDAETESELVFNDVFDNVMGVNSDVGIGGTGVFGRAANSGDAGKQYGIDSLACLTVTKTFLNAPSLFPVKFVLDFGVSCTDNQGHTRSGKIIIVYTGRLVHAGSIATTTFENYKIDGIAVTGTHKVTNSTAQGSNQKQFTIDVIDAKLTKPNGNYHRWTSHRVITQIEGNGTPLAIDDVFKITGYAFGKVLRGNTLYAWNSEIIEPLMKKFICQWISKGIIRVKRDTLPSTSPWVAILNFGAGNCDFLATLTINGVTHNIQLPH